MNDLRSLTDLRTTPLWQHHLVNHIHQVPQDSGSFQLADVPIHRIWRLSAWRTFSHAVNLGHSEELARYDNPAFDISRRLYDRLQPALKLATILLNRAVPFLIRITHGSVFEAGSDITLSASWTPTNADYQSFRQMLDGVLPAQYRILRLDDNQNSQCYAQTTRSRSQNNPRSYICAMSQQMLNEIEEDAWTLKNSMQQASILAVVATCLVHELAHALIHWRLDADEFVGQPTMRRLRAVRKEPFVEPEKFSELGFSAERFLFGCELHYYLKQVMPTVNPLGMQQVLKADGTPVYLADGRSMFIRGGVPFWHANGLPQFVSNGMGVIDVPTGQPILSPSTGQPLLIAWVAPGAATYDSNGNLVPLLPLRGLTGEEYQDSQGQPVRIASGQQVLDAQGNTLYAANSQNPLYVLSQKPLQPQQQLPSEVCMFDCSRGISAEIDISPNQDKDPAFRTFYHVAVETIMSFFDKQEWTLPPKSIYLFPILENKSDSTNWPYVGMPMDQRYVNFFG